MKRRWSWWWAPLKVELTTADVMADLDPGWAAWRPAATEAREKA